MIWTSILSFNSSVWLHLTLYISWEQSNIPQHSTILACWDTLPLQGQKDEPRPKKKKPNSPRFSLLLCGWQSFIFLGVQKAGEELSSRLLSFPNCSWEGWSWNLLKEKGFFALLKESGDGGRGFGEFQDLHHLSPSPSPIPAFGPQIKPPSEATLGVRIDREGWAGVI